MATAGDIRDIMDLGRDGPRPVAALKKKKKQIDHGRISGMSREVQALMGDSVPPVAIVENPKYKSKPSIAMKAFKARPWDNRSFVHAARNDGLVLKHWKRSLPGSGPRPTQYSADTEMTDAEKELQPEEMQFEDDFPSEKWNVHVNVVSYTDDQYEKYFTTEDWTKEETDYLMDLCRQYDLRWILIADRYDYTEIKQVQQSQTEAANHTTRTMEAMKSRYYQISAKMLEAITPASQMTNAEFQLWEKMRNFDAKAETTRKAMAEKLFERTKDEAEEEKVLLEELHRITKNEEDFIKMRKDLYSRLETAPSLRRNERGEEQPTAIYQSSHGLSMLLSTLLAKERKLKRAMPNGDTASAATPTEQKRPGQAQRRETIDSQVDDAGPSKKGSVSQPVVRTLTPAEQLKYGVSHPQERLTSGVTFRHEKINRITTAKSQVQTQKIQAALTELGIPPRLLMPTERVCREFERLVAEVQLLLDARRGLEKVASEVKVLEEHKRIRLGQNDPDTKVDGDAMDVDNSTVTKDEGTAVKAESEDKDEDNVDESVIDETKVDEADDDEIEPSVIEDDEADKSVMQGDDDDEDNEDADEEDEEEDGEEAEVDEDENDDEGEDDDAPGLDDLERANQVTDDEDDEEEPDEDEEDAEDGDNEVEVEESVLNGDGAEIDDTADLEETEETSRPSSSHRSHKRSASIISDASKAGSNRSGLGRKRRR